MYGNVYNAVNQVFLEYREAEEQDI